MKGKEGCILKSFPYILFIQEGKKGFWVQYSNESWQKNEVQIAPHIPLGFAPLS